MCKPHYREIPGGLFARIRSQTETADSSGIDPESSETERDVQAQMEDGFGEALPTRFLEEYQSPL